CTFRIFFFQAEDGIRDFHVTGVQTCALPILAALKEAVKTQTIERREPMVLTFDVLLQFLVTIALGGGFTAEDMLQIVRKTYGFSELTDEEWQWCLTFITQGGSIGKNYEDFHKVTR